MPFKPDIVGVILAGGLSRRFGGGDKGLADLCGRPVLGHVVERFRPQVGALVLNANGDAGRFEQFGLGVIADGESPGLGPLSGLLAALDWTRDNTPAGALVATVSADVPFLPLDLVGRLVAERGGGAAIAVSGGRRHPTIGLWPQDIRANVADALQRKALSIDAFAHSLGAVAVPFPMRDIEGAAVDPFFNVNTQDDLAAARAVLAGLQRDERSHER